METLRFAQGDIASSTFQDFPGFNRMVVRKDIDIEGLKQISIRIPDAAQRDERADGMDLLDILRLEHAVRNADAIRFDLTQITRIVDQPSGQQRPGGQLRMRTLCMK